MNEKIGTQRCGSIPRCACDPGCCIDTYRIYDSCIGQECLRNLRFCTTDQYQPILNTATAVRIREISVLWVRILSEEVPFRTGYYSITARYYFRVTLEACQGLGTPQIIYGLACYDKNVILYGGEGNVSIFYSDAQQNFCSQIPDLSQSIGGNSSPRVVTEIATPVGLEVNLIETAEEDVPLCCQNLPDEITAQFEGSFTNVGEITQSAFVTLGIFTLIRVERPAQLTMENCENCFPDKTCDSSGVFTDACTLFSSMQFPYEEFAPTVRCDRTDLSVERESQDPLLSPDDYR